MVEATFGMSDEFPVPADYDVDGKTNLAVYNKNTHVWRIRRSSNLKTYTVNFGNEYGIPLVLPVHTYQGFIPCS